MSAVPDDTAELANPAPVRVAPRKLALRVNGARPGTDVRPASSGAVTAVVPAPPRGLRVHTSPLAPRPAVLPVNEPYDWE